ncbi:MAG: 4Fe-4S dicluster domain-containing protein [Thermodesulfobacteriota bacterium]
MADREKDKGKISRREFIAGAGTLLVIGAVPNIAVSATATIKKANQKLLEGVPVSSVIVHDPDLCAGCGVCGLMCAFVHEKEYGPSLSRNELIRDPFNGIYTFLVCQQCTSPDCYFACLNKDKALCVDKKSGVKYVNTAECVGCGACTKACRFSPPRANVHPIKKVSFKCDLCRGRVEGPVCVEYCTMKALRLVPGKERGVA